MNFRALMIPPIPTSTRAAPTRTMKGTTDERMWEAGRLGQVLFLHRVRMDGAECVQ